MAKSPMSLYERTYREYLDPAFREAELQKIKAELLVEKTKMEEKMSKTKQQLEPQLIPSYDNMDDFFPDYSEGAPKQPLTIKTGPRNLSEPLTTPEEDAVLEQFYKKDINKLFDRTEAYGLRTFDPKDPWIQTFSGKRFTPTNPVVSDIVIEDIAHSLSMQCRFSGHTKKFYSVAQHSVLVSFICDSADAFWGLMHDASEAYLVDVPRPLKQSGKFDSYLEFEKTMQNAICAKFNMKPVEPASVKKADMLLLVTEARDLMYPVRSDWTSPFKPLPFKIDPLPPQEAKDLFMQRFTELTK